MLGAEIPDRCRCPFCLYSEAWNRGETDHPPPTPMEELECQNMQRLDSRLSLPEDERAWWARFEPHYRPWICAAVERGECLEPYAAQHGAWVLIWLGTARHDPVTREEWPGQTLDDLHGHEIFEAFGHGMLYKGDDARWTVWGTVSFARYLCDLGAFAPGQAASLNRELEVWAPRVVAFFEEDGPWYLRDGAPVWLDRG